MKLLNTRQGRWRLGFLSLALFCFASVGFALVLQFQDLAPPCPLCIFQRLGVMACGLIALLATIWPPQRHALWWPVLLSAGAVIGAGVSIRHISIQSAAAAGDLSASCGASLDYMLQMDSVPNVIASVLTGHGDCTVIEWQFMGITLPMLALAGFVLMAAWALGVHRWAMLAHAEGQ